MTKPGVYKHWKGMSYRVLFTATTATNKVAKSAGGPQVVYMSLANGELYVRSEIEFHEQIDVNAGDPSAPCLCDARGQGSCRMHPGDPKMQPRFKLTKEMP